MYISARYIGSDVFIAHLFPHMHTHTADITHAEDPSVDWQPLANALKLLPKAHYNVLKYLAEHLSRYIHTIHFVQFMCSCHIHVLGGCGALLSGHTVATAYYKRIVRWFAQLS